MSRDVIRLMQALFPQSAQGCAGAWCPAADLYRTRAGWLVKLDLAGVRPEDVRIWVEARRLSVSGCRRDCTLSEDCSHYHLEIAYSHFERHFELPDELDAASISTDYRDGMLHVHVRKELTR
jgi:HSP20 family protein